MLSVLSVVSVWVALRWDAQAAPPGAGERAQSIIVELEADASVRDLVGPALQHAKDAAARAESAAPGPAALLQETALEWAEVARDLTRTSVAERGSDHLEQEASGLETEIARVRAAVEQTLARVGRARQDLKDLEGGSAAAAPAPKGAAR